MGVTQGGHADHAILEAVSFPCCPDLVTVGIGTACPTLSPRAACLRVPHLHFAAVRGSGTQPGRGPGAGPAPWSPSLRWPLTSLWTLMSFLPLTSHAHSAAHRQSCFPCLLSALGCPMVPEPGPAWAQLLQALCPHPAPALFQDENQALHIHAASLNTAPCADWKISFANQPEGEGWGSGREVPKGSKHSSPGRVGVGSQSKAAPLQQARHSLAKRALAKGCRDSCYAGVARKAAVRSGACHRGPFPAQLPLTHLRRQYMVAQVLQPLAPAWETRRKHLGAGFGLVQGWLLPSSWE